MMLEELIPIAARVIAALIDLVAKAGEAAGLTRAEALAKLRASEHLADTIDDAEWAELTR